jgi:hypothetical protein
MMRTSRLQNNGTLLFTAEARHQLAMGEPRRAIETCKLGLARHPDHAAGYVVLAAAYRSVGEDDRARLVLLRGFERTGLDRLRQLAEAGAPASAPERTASAGTTSARAASPEENPPTTDTPAANGNGAIAHGDAASDAAVDELATVSVEPGSIAEHETATPEIDSREVPVADHVPEQSSTDESAAARLESSVTEQLSPAQRELEAPSTGEVQICSPTPEKPDVAEPTPTRPEIPATPAERPEQPPTAPLAPEQPAPEQPAPEVQPAAEPQPAPIQQPSAEEKSAAEELPAPTVQPAPESDPIAAEESHSPLELVEERAAESAQDSPATEQLEQVRPASAGGLAVVERPVERAPWFQRRTPRPSDRPQGSSLALHSGKSAHRLTSANLRLIPGLEYAPLRAEDQGRRMMIAPIMEDPLPDWEPRRRTSTVDNAPPLPEYPPVTSAPAVAPTTTPVEAQRSVSETTPAFATGPKIETPTQTTPGLATHLAPRPMTAGSDVSEQVVASPHAASTGGKQDRRTAGRAPAETADTSEIDELARRLEGARIAPVGDAPAPPRHVFEPSIVSDTLADILVAQGAYGEAIKAFMTLARMRPAQLKYYEERIAEMKRRILEERDAES